MLRAVRGLVARRHRSLLTTLALLTIGVGLIAKFYGKNTTVKKFEWTSSASASKQYPVELIRGDLRLADGSAYYVPDKRAVHHGWGEIGATHFVGDDRKAMPTSLDALWFSYAEDRFYALQADLPADTMLAMFEEGIRGPRRGETLDYDRIVFGFGPEGVAAIWLSGAGNRVWLAGMLGEPVEADWRQVVDNPEITRREFIDTVLTEALGAEGAKRRQEDRYAQGTWPRRQQRHDWAIEVSGAKEILTLRLESLDGEALHFSPSLTSVVDRSDYGVPRLLAVQWTGLAEQRRSATITFDEEEALAAFEKLALQEGPLVLTVEISETSNSVVTELHAKHYTYAFESVKVDLFSR